MENVLETIVKYLRRIGVQLSCLLNVLLGGYSNQTFSARNWDWHRRGLPNIAKPIDVVFEMFTGNPDHCLQCWVYWKVRFVDPIQT